MNNEPQDEHRWLHRLVGEWEGEGEMPGPPGEAPTTWRSVQSVRKIGELWIQCEARSETDGGTDIMQITLGYDPALGRYVGVFAGSMMSKMWIYEGRVEADGRTLTLDTEGPDFGGGEQTRKYQDIVELIDDDHHELRSRMLGEDGQWRPVMAVRYRRTG